MDNKQFYPLSKVQQEILAFEIEYPGTSINNICFWIHPMTTYTREEAEASVQLIIKNSQAIRLEMHREGEAFCQYEAKYTKRPVAWYADKTKTCAELVALQKEAAAVPFALWDSPLYRITLLEGSDGIAAFACIHHLVLDGWGSTQFIIQFFENCGKLHAGETIKYHKCKYTDFVAYEAEQAQGPRYDKDKEFWQELFRDYAGPALIKPGAPGYELEVFPQGNRLSKVVPAQLMQDMLGFCNDNGISSPSIICKAAILCYLHKKNPWLQRVDMGEMILNRRRSVDKVSLGNYAAEILVGAEITTETTSLELLNQVQGFSRNAYRHTRYLHDDILEFVQESNPDMELIRDVEFGYFPNLGYDDKTNVEAGWIFNGVPETTVECVLYDFYGDTLLLLDYQDHILDEADAVNFQDNILYLMEKFITEPDGLVDDITLKE